MTRLIPYAIAALLVAFAVACEQDPSSDLPDFCLTPADCVGFQAGECQAVDCTDGQCSVVADAAADGVACGMSDPCMAVAGLCDGGTCVGAVPVECPGVGCMIGTCDRELGRCVYSAAGDGVSCDRDGNPCTADVCRGGDCSGGVNECPCGDAGDCPAMDDRCLGRWNCTGSVCVIEPFSAVVCPEPGDCDAFACDPASGLCVRKQATNGTICSHADSCNAGGLCTDGVCVVTPRCSDENPCTDDLCDAASGACSFPANQAPCDDGDACTGDGACSGGVCVTRQVSCDDMNDCTVDVCDRVTGCAGEPVLPGTSCDSGDPCAIDEVCGQDGMCGGGTPKCDDRNACTSDRCDPSTGACSYENLAGTCDDGDPCTVGERCSSGVCGGGASVPGCCNFDADCDDRDLCTPTACVLGKCVAPGQDPAGCPPSPDGCGIDWCDASTGGCLPADAGIPLLIASWDFAGGAPLTGFVWGEPAGRIVAGGLSAAGSGGASFLLPRRLVPPGVVMVYMELTFGACGDVSFPAGPDATACVEFEGHKWVLAAFDTTRATDPDGRLSVTTYIANLAIVSRAFVYLWAVSGCQSPGIAAGDAAVTDLSMAASMDGAAVVYNTGSAVAASVLSPGGKWRIMPRTDPPFAVVAGRFSTSVVRTGSGYLAAWGGADDAVAVAPFDAAGWGPATTMPDIGESESIEAWPALASIPGGGHAIALAYGDGVDFDIALAPLGADGVPSSEFARVNESVMGVQSNPSIVFGVDSGILVWANATVDGLEQYKIVGRRLSANVSTQLSQFDLVTKASLVSSPRCTVSGTSYYCLWQHVDGSVGGSIVSASTFEPSQTFSFGSSTTPDSRPLILPAGDGAVVLSIEGSGATASIVARTVSADGAVSAPWIVATPVLANQTRLAAGSFVPGMYLLAFTDHLGDPGGLRISVFSPSCQSGFVDGGSACTGIGEGRLGGVLP